MRAGIVSQPEDYPWSGHLAYLGKEQLSWLTTEWILSQFSADIVPARKAYCEFVQAGMDECRRSEFHSGSLEGRILGDDSFVEEILHKAGQQHHQTKPLVEIVNAVCHYFSISLKELAALGKTKSHSEARAFTAFLDGSQRIIH